LKTRDHVSPPSSVSRPVRDGSSRCRASCSVDRRDLRGAWPDPLWSRRAVGTSAARAAPTGSSLRPRGCWKSWRRRRLGLRLLQPFAPKVLDFARLRKAVRVENRVFRPNHSWSSAKASLASATARVTGREGP
jgi:hypothetical protein